jgi:hypothetical protein
MGRAKSTFVNIRRKPRTARAMELSNELGVSPTPIDTPKCKCHLYIRAPFLGSPFRSLSGTGYRPLHGVRFRKEVFHFPCFTVLFTFGGRASALHGGPSVHGVISRKARQRPEAEHHGIEHKGVPAIHKGSEGSCGKITSPFAAEFIFCSVNGEDQRTKKFHLIGKFMPA